MFNRLIAKIYRKKIGIVVFFILLLMPIFTAMCGHWELQQHVRSPGFFEEMTKNPSELAKYNPEEVSFWRFANPMFLTLDLPVWPMILGFFIVIAIFIQGISMKFEGNSYGNNEFHRFAAGALMTIVSVVILLICAMAYDSMIENTSLASYEHKRLLNSINLLGTEDEILLHNVFLLQGVCWPVCYYFVSLMIAAILHYPIGTNRAGRAYDKNNVVRLKIRSGIVTIRQRKKPVGSTQNFLCFIPGFELVSKNKLQHWYKHIGQSVMSSIGHASLKSSRDLLTEQLKAKMRDFRFSLLSKYIKTRLPDNCHWHVASGNTDIYVVQVEPHTRWLKFKKTGNYSISDQEAQAHWDLFHEEVKPLSEFKLALPYMIFVAVIEGGALSGLFLYFRNERLKDNEKNYLFYPCLPNVNERNGERICLGRYDYGLNGASPASKVNHAVATFFDQEFNSSDPYKRTRDDKRIATLYKWQENTEENPDFITEVKWQEAGMTVNDVIMQCLSRDESADRVIDRLANATISSPSWGKGETLSGLVESPGALIEQAFDLAYNTEVDEIDEEDDEEDETGEENEGR